MNAKIKELVKDHLITSEYTESGSQTCHKYEFDETELNDFVDSIIKECIESIQATTVESVAFDRTLMENMHLSINDIVKLFL